MQPIGCWDGSRAAPPPRPRADLAPPHTRLQKSFPYKPRAQLPQEPPQANLSAAGRS